VSVQEDARAEVNRRHPWHHDNGVGIVQGSHYRAGFVDGAEWAKAQMDVMDVTDIENTV